MMKHIGDGHSSLMHFCTPFFSAASSKPWLTKLLLSKPELFRRQIYCETLNVCVPFISRAKQNREIKGREYHVHAKKIGRNYYSYYSISSYMVLIRPNERGENNFACKVANF